MKKKILSFVLVLCLIIPCVIMTGCNEKTNNVNDQTTAKTKVVYLDNETAWNVYVEAKYKLITSYDNCLMNFTIERNTYYQDCTSGTKTVLEYLKADHDRVLNYFIIRENIESFGQRTEKSSNLKYIDNGQIYLYDILNNTKNVISQASYNGFLYNYQFECLTEENICYDNLLSCIIKEDGSYVLKFCKTYEETENFIYDEYYEVTISNNFMFEGYKRSSKIPGSAGYAQWIEKYSYGNVNSEELLSLINQ